VYWGNIAGGEASKYWSSSYDIQLGDFGYMRGKVTCCNDGTWQGWKHRVSMWKLCPGCSGLVWYMPP